MRVIKTLISALSAIFFLTLAVGSSEDSSSSYSDYSYESSYSSTPDVGGKVRIKNKAFAASSERTFDRMISLINANDEVGITEMLINGQIRVIEPGQTGKLIDIHFTYSEIRFDDDYQTWCVNNEFFSKSY